MMDLDEVEEPIVKKHAQEQSQETYKRFLQFGKYFCYVVLFLILLCHTKLVRRWNW